VDAVVSEVIAEAIALSRQSPRLMIIRSGPRVCGSWLAVPVPHLLADMLAVEIAGKAKDDLVFTTQTGRPLRNLNFWRDHFDHATTEVGLDGLTPHELCPNTPRALEPT
jgi:hypothetical protein